VFTAKARSGRLSKSFKQKNDFVAEDITNNPMSRDNRTIAPPPPALPGCRYNVTRPRVFVNIFETSEQNPQTKTVILQRADERLFRTSLHFTFRTERSTRVLQGTDLYVLWSANTFPYRNGSCKAF